MLNLMILNEIQTLDDIKTLNIDGFVYNEDLSHEYQLAFVREKV